jgi:hypothetical protein
MVRSNGKTKSDYAAARKQRRDFDKRQRDANLGGDPKPWTDEEREKERKRQEAIAKEWEKERERRAKLTQKERDAEDDARLGGPSCVLC